LGRDPDGFPSPELHRVSLGECGEGVASSKLKPAGQEQQVEHGQEGVVEQGQPAASMIDDVVREQAEKHGADHHPENPADDREQRSRGLIGRHENNS
jgi:hypothetical protein